MQIKIINCISCNKEVHKNSPTHKYCKDCYKVHAREEDKKRLNGLDYSGYKYTWSKKREGTISKSTIYRRLKKKIVI